MNTLKKTSRDSRQYHGLGGTPTYATWYSMIERCGNRDSASWVYYGGVGIKVCDRWLDIENFVADMGLRPDGMSLDRIDTAGDYEPSNCRWATELEQQRNRSNVKCTELMAADIRAKSMRGARNSDLATEFGLDRSTISRIVCWKIWR